MTCSIRAVRSAAEQQRSDMARLCFKWDQSSKTGSSLSVQAKSCGPAVAAYVSLQVCLCTRVPVCVL